jgi:glycosyltransferase involved in cell wall biosynthesis
VRRPFGRPSVMQAIVSDNVPQTTEVHAMEREVGPMPEDLIIHVYAVCWNEEKILPYFLRHYSSFAERIVVYDNNSTDGSQEIVRKWPKAELRTFDTGDTFDDVVITEIMNKGYKESRGKADFVVVVATDELLWHPNMKRILLEYKRCGVTLPKVQGYDMVSWRFPRGQKQITGLVVRGRENPWYAKRCIFDPAVDINFNPCCHTCSPAGDVIESDVADLKVLHYHYLGYWHIVRKHRLRGRRLSTWNRINHKGRQFRAGPLLILAMFLSRTADAFDVFNGKQSWLSKVLRPSVGWAKTRVRRAMRCAGKEV